MPVKLNLTGQWLRLSFLHMQAHSLTRLHVSHVKAPGQKQQVTSVEGQRHVQAWVLCMPMPARRGGGGTT